MFRVHQPPVRVEQRCTFLRLFELQDQLIEHKFPHEKAQVMDDIISAAGDIYREMVGGVYKHTTPYYGYIDEKWSKLTKYTSFRIPYLTEGDWTEFKEQHMVPSYGTRRDEYLRNLNILRDETSKTPMDGKRKDVLLAALDLIEGLISWFEGLIPRAMPTQQMERLTGTIADYFPKLFWREKS